MRSRFTQWSKLLIVFGITSLGCTGDVLDGPRGAEGGDDGGSAGVLGASQLRRLARREYDNTLRDLLGEHEALSHRFPVEDSPHGYDNHVSARSVPPLLAERYLIVAEELAARVVPRVEALAGCDGARDESCVERLIRGFGQRAYRRPLDEEEIERLFAVYRDGASRRGFDGGVELVLRTMLASPNFLYRVERGEPDDAAPSGRRPTSFEMASRLSYLLWATMPDEALFAAAEADALRSPEEIRAQVTRMLADPRAKEMARQFAAQWLSLDRITRIQRSEEQFPAFSPELVPLLRREAELFIEEAFWRAPDGIRALYRGRTTFRNAALAAFYGSPGPSGEDFEVVTMEENRAGLLTLAGVLAGFSHPSQTSPTLRGEFVRDHLLCTKLPPPPPDVNNNLPPPSTGTTTRERLEVHASTPTCNVCHRLVDPIGLSLENFDAIGLYREDEDGSPIDATGEVVDSDIEGPYVGAVELAERLSESAQALDCVARQWFRFSFGRREATEDLPLIESLVAELNGNESDTANLLTAIATSDEFHGLSTRPEVP